MANEPNPDSPSLGGLPTAGFADSRSPIPSAGEANEWLEATEEGQDHFYRLRMERAYLMAKSNRLREDYMKRQESLAADPLRRQKFLEEVQVMSRRHFEAKAKMAASEPAATPTGAGGSKKRPYPQAKAQPGGGGDKVYCGGGGGGGPFGAQRPLTTSTFMASGQFAAGSHQPVRYEPPLLRPIVDAAQPGTSQGQAQARPTPFDVNSFAKDLDMPRHVVVDLFKTLPPRFDDAVCSKFFQDFEQQTNTGRPVVAQSLVDFEDNEQPLDLRNFAAERPHASSGQFYATGANDKYDVGPLKNNFAMQQAAGSAPVHYQTMAKAPYASPFDASSVNVSWLPNAHASTSQQGQRVNDTVYSEQYWPGHHAGAQPPRMANGLVQLNFNNNNPLFYNANTAYTPAEYKGRKAQ